MIKHKLKDKVEVPENPKAPAKKPEEVKSEVPLEELPKEGPVKVVDVNGHTITLPSLESAQSYIKVSGGKIIA